MQAASVFSECDRARAPGLIDLEDPSPWRALDKESFAFRHRLAGHPLLEIPRLAALSEKVFDRIDYARYFLPEQMRLGVPELRRRLREDVLGIGSSKRWLALRNVNEMDREYQALFEQLLTDVEALAGGPIRERMTWGGLTVFLNSPGLVVPYHFDHETNFLMQVRGEKEVWLYPNDRSVLTEAEIEDFYRHNPVAGRWRDELANAGTSYRLTPGVGVHHPPLAPHRIRNGDQVSISLSMYYTLPATDDLAHVYQANFFLRKLGLHPRPPGQSRLVDEAKIRFIRALSMSHPRTQDERLYSGISRLGLPLRLAKRMRAPRGGAQTAA